MKVVPGIKSFHLGFEDGLRPTRVMVGGLRVILLGAAILVGCVLCIQYIYGGPTQLSGWVLVLGLLLSVIANYFVKRDILYPATAFSAVWLVVSVVYLFFPYEIDPLSWTTVSIFLCGHLAFGMGCALGRRPWGHGGVWFTTPVRSDQFRRALLVYSITMVPVVLYSAMKLVGIWSISPVLFIAVRDAIVSGQEARTSIYNNALVSTAPTISVSVAFLLIIEEKNRWLKGAGIVSAFALVLLTTGRPLLLLLTSGWLMLALLSKTVRPIELLAKQLASVSALILLCLSLVTLLTKSEMQSDSRGNVSLLDATMSMTAHYVAGPLAGFNYVVEHPESFAGSDNITFAQVLGPASSIGFRYTPPPEYDSFFPVPFLFNVFTSFKNYYVDFGVVGCPIAFFLLGTISGGVFDAAIRKNQLAIFAYAYLFFAILFTPFQDVFHSFGRYAYVLCFISFYYVVSRRIPIVQLFHTPKRALV